jgi:hypothetical protein
MPHDRRVVKTNFDPFTNDFHDDRRNRHDRYNANFESRFLRVSPDSRTSDRNGAEIAKISLNLLSFRI